MMMGTRPNPQIQREQKDLTIMTLNVPAVNCSHCKMKIEQEVGKLSGVTAVNVDLDAKQVVIKLILPPTKTEIENLLTEIGYPPEIQ